MTIEQANIKVDFDNSDYIDNKTGEVYNYIRIVVKKCVTKEGKIFYAYNGVLKNGKYIDIRFTRASGFTEMQSNFIVVGFTYNIDKNRLYPRMYITTYLAIDQFRPIKDKIEI